MRFRTLIIAGLILLAIAVGAAWVLPSDSYLLLPDTAKPLAGKVEVEGEKPRGPGGIYYVDVIVREASLLEEIAAPVRPEGAEDEPGDDKGAELQWALGFTAGLWEARRRPRAQRR